MHALGVARFGCLGFACFSSFFYAWHGKSALTRAVDKFIRESSCRHMQSLGSPCASFDEASEGKCKRDGHICDLLTEKGERYLREYE